MKKINLIVLILAMSVLGIISIQCKKNSDITGTTGSGGTPISDAERTAALDSVGKVFSALSGLSVKAFNQQMATYLKGRKEFEDAGTSDSGGNVWARFTDGRLLIVANNRPIDSSAAQIPIPGKAAVASTKDPQLPGSRKARLLNAMGTAFKDPLPGLGAMLGSKGYQVTPGIGDIGTLEHVKGDGIFYLDSHGGEGHLRNGKIVFGIWTATKQNPANDVLYLPELKTDMLCYFEATQDKLSNGTYSAETHYGITAEFVNNFMSFEKNSLIYIDACRSFNPGFREMCLSMSNQTGLYVGWSDWVADTSAFKAAEFLFDRLLGMNAQFVKDKEHPPQRPFDYQAVWTDMERLGLDQYKDPNDPTNVAWLSRQAGGNSEFALLSPTIQSLFVDELKEELHVVGIFGTNEGRVTINDVDATVNKWTSTEITCKIDPSGPQSAGSILVSVDGRESNVVQLTEWIGQFRYAIASIGSLTQEWHFDVHLRGDVHSFRDQPHADPHPLHPYWTLAEVKDSRASFSASGQGGVSYTEPPCDITETESWSAGGVSIPYLTELGAQTGFDIPVRIDAKAKEMMFIFRAAASKAVLWNHVYTAYCPDPGTFNSSATSDAIGLGDTVWLNLDENFSIAQGHHDTSKTSVTYHIAWNGQDPPKRPMHVEWDQIQANYPPDPDAARRIEYSAHEGLQTSERKIP